MGLIQENIKVRVNNFNKNHFENLGYYVEINSYINIKVEELPTGSGLKIKVKCDYCGKEFNKAYRRYLKTKDKLCCDKCKTQKFQETIIEKYGVDCTLKIPEIAEKVKASNLEKFGCECVLSNEGIREKCRKTMYNRYSVYYSFQYKEFYEKANATMKMKYGKGVISTSKAQSYLNNLYNGILNYNIERYFIDIFLEEYNICCEYNGGGHNLAVIHGRCTQEEFDKKDQEKYKTIIKNGFKCFVIISTKDKLPPDEKLIEIKEKAINFLINENYDIYIYDIENKSEKLLKCNEL